MIPARIIDRTPPDRLREAFARDFGARPAGWSGHNLSRMLRATGERPARVEAMRAILGDFGLGDRRRSCNWISAGGVFDHGQLWLRSGLPSILVGHPYGIDDDEHAMLAELRRFRVLRVAVDDRVSNYGFGNNHDRVVLAEPRRPFREFPATPKTRAFRRAARAAFADVFAE